MFDLQSYCDKQRELDAMLSTEPDELQLIAAVTAEAGEVVNALKYGEEGWVWWPRRDKKEADREEVLGEMIDLLHFLLLGYNIRNGGIVPAFHQMLVEEMRPVFDGEKLSVSFYPQEIIHYANMNRYHEAIRFWLDFANSLGFSEEDIEKGFEKSVHKNISRWTS